MNTEYTKFTNEKTQYIVIKAIKYLDNIHLDHKYQFRYSLRINDHAKSQRRKLKLQLSDNQA